jgi:hypothetical protein
MNARIQKAVLDSFVRSLDGTVKKYLCFGIYQQSPICAKCTVKKQCKAATPKGVI